VLLESDDPELLEFGPPLLDSTSTPLAPEPLLEPLDADWRELVEPDP